MPARLSTATLAISVLLAFCGLALLGLGYSLYLNHQLQGQLVALSTQLDQAVSPVRLRAVIESTLVDLRNEQRLAEQQALFAGYQAASSNLGERHPNQHIYGNTQARFTLVEFADTECGYCKRFHSTPKQIVDASNGAVNWEYKSMPILSAASLLHANALECVAEVNGNPAFWVFLDQLYQHTGSTPIDLLALANKLGVEESGFKRCLAERRHQGKIDASLEMAKHNGVHGTPATFVVDNHTGQRLLLGGAQPLEAFLAAMRRLQSEASDSRVVSGDEPG